LRLDTEGAYSTRLTLFRWILLGDHPKVCGVGSW
jgi:hypothetical protein